MTRRLPLFIGALALVTAIGTAEAGHVHFGGGVHFSSGGSSWSGGVHISSGYHWSRPVYGGGSSWGVHGHIWVGGYYPYYYRPYYYYYPEYVPSYYGTYYYPVQPAASVAAPGIAAVVAPQPELPRFGIGLFAGAVNTPDYQASNTSETDVGVLGRFRLTPGLLVEGELGKTSTSANGSDNLRVDRRLGGSLVYEIGAYNSFAPYVLAGLGVQQAQVAGDYSTTQDYGEIGAGLRFAVSRNLHILADIRAGSRATVSNDAPAMLQNGTARMVAPPTTQDNKNEDYTRGRIAVMLYF